jgi:phosphate-selective porin
LSANYTLNNLRPLIKYENSEVKVANDADNASSFKRNAFTVGVEFLTSDSLRWQVAYVNAADKNGSAATNDKTTYSQYIAGLKWDTDFLK